MKLLKIELEEHSEVESELAKRSHFCQRVITKYKTQIKLLKDEQEEKKHKSLDQFNEGIRRYD